MSKEDFIVPSWGAKEIDVSKLSMNDKRDMLEKAIKDKIGVVDTMIVDLWIRDLFDTEAIYELKRALFKITYKIASNGVVTLGDPVEVISKTTYEVKT